MEQDLVRVVENAAINFGFNGDNRTLQPNIFRQAMAMVQSTADTLPPWWSMPRERRLEEVAVDNDYLAGLVYLATTKLTNIPLRFVAKNPSNTRDADHAIQFTKKIVTASEFAAGLTVAMKKFSLDYIVHDNGGWMEVIDEGQSDPAGPIVGEPMMVRHLDTMRVQRTGHPIFPILYMDPITNKRSKIHFTRVIGMTQQPSGRAEMFGVGLSSISRSYVIAEMLGGQLQYKMEKMGSKPNTQIIEGSGVSAEYLYQAFMVAEEMARNLGLKRFARKIFIGMDQGSGLNTHDLNNLDPFDEKDSLTVGHFALAYIWGFKVQDIWPMGGSKAGDEVAVVQSRGRLMSDFTKGMTEQMETRLCPPNLKPEFDYLDDDEDQQDAVIRDIRSRSYQRLSEQGITDTEGLRRIMFLDGNLTREEFVRMQLEDGKTEDGNDIAVVFYSTDPIIRALTDLQGVESPLLYEQNDPEYVVGQIHIQQSACYEALAMVNNRPQEQNVRYALAGLSWLESRYTGMMPITVQGESADEQEQQQQQGESAGPEEQA